MAEREPPHLVDALHEVVADRPVSRMRATDGSDVAIEPCFEHIDVYDDVARLYASPEATTASLVETLVRARRCELDPVLSFDVPGWLSE